jgi:hypothetical protein
VRGGASVTRGEAVRFAQLADENFSAHRLSASGQISAGRWRFVGEGSSVIIAGGSETLPTCGAVNANALAVWRDRRENRQHRLKLQTEATAGAWVLRGSGTFLANDFHTRAVAGAFAFADRDDAVAGVDLGRRQAAGALAFFGVRRGRQNQAVVPLPGCEFDYSSDYSRVVAGWEGRLWSGVSMTFAAGPDFRRFTGAIDPRAMPGGRERTSFWYEGGLVAKLAPEVTLTAKAAQMDWLSSTGKSAYVDSFGEAAITWTPRGDVGLAWFGPGASLRLLPGGARRLGGVAGRGRNVDAAARREAELRCAAPPRLECREWRKRAGIPAARGHVRRDDPALTRQRTTADGRGNASGSCVLRGELCAVRAGGTGSAGVKLFQALG